MPIIGPITNVIIDEIICEVKKPNNKKRIIKYIIDPLFVNIINKYYPYVLSFIVILLLIVILLFIIIILAIIDRQ